ncbi:hypothetical protein BCV69DRAFT_219998 [Microstroma glucosiphilum]|uniref:Uncharacterized protein n=1 Tax=Pseudomicrostroma glucosiphilum TaxID=1684307 RepID=A0A316U4C4_9BASI|nr:hypothetical protein BCV69DRAFT_219998 [Pseudomicrostroma glucosiphilum]PWN20109.1 hypothetical protein BCV69DRAFT_219998 [Pseudomicrostroma glucosiphilum]
MPSSALPRRKYALSPGRGAPSPGLETPFTPTEELFSWLPDEQCAACGAQVKASQLYCSDACRQKEGAENHRNHQDDLLAHGSSFLTPASAPPTAKLAPSTRHYFPNTTAADIDSLQRFRYPCPPSPSLVAQRKTTPGERNLPTNFFGAQGNVSYRPRNVSRTSSRGEFHGIRPSLARRSSADSTDSSLASSSAFLTDPSTPSPGMANRGCDSASSNRSNASIDDEDLNSSDFRLPPSVSPATAAMLTANHQSVYHHRSRSDRQVSPTQHQYPRRPRTSVGDGCETASAAPSSTIAFARRPGSTNVPAPILYSPVLAAKNSTVNAEGTVTRRSYKSRSDLRRSFDQIKAGLCGSFGGPSASAASVDTPARSPLDTGLSMRVQRTRSDPSAEIQAHAEGEASPEQHDSGASGSSSAARTMRAISPGSLTASNEVCGRPGKLLSPWLPRY